MPQLQAFRAPCPPIEPELISGNAFFNPSKREADVALRPGSRERDGTWSAASSPRSAATR